VGFEPTDGGFADLSLRPLGYRAGCKEYIETVIELSVVETKGEFACSTGTDFLIQRRENFGSARQVLALLS
jgi:hypothetical protein